MRRIEPDDICEPEWADWYRLTPAERWEQSAQLWATFVTLGGTLDPDPDTQSPFSDPEARSEVAADGGSGVHLLRRSGV
ncbi:MAG: hypothetical protein ABIU86_14850 [Gemmatimonadaceae bacterium]